MDTAYSMETIKKNWVYVSEMWDYKIFDRKIYVRAKNIREENNRQNLGNITKDE